jgi:predicted nucleic acid-binding protein
MRFFMFHYRFPLSRGVSCGFLWISADVCGCLRTFEEQRGSLRMWRGFALESPWPHNKIGVSGENESLPIQLLASPDCEHENLLRCLLRESIADDHSQERIFREAEAIEALIGLATSDPNVWVGSIVLEAELSRNLDSDRREDAEALLTFAKQVVKLDDGIIVRACDLQTVGFSEFDALYLACAETGQVDVFLTTDDRLIRAARRASSKLAIRVLNPVSFWEEVKNANPRND